MDCSTEYLVYKTHYFDTLPIRDQSVTSTQVYALSLPEVDVRHPVSGKADFPSMPLIPERFRPTWDVPFLRRAHLRSQQYVQFARIQETLEEIRRQGLKITQPDEVQDYLRRYPELIYVVPEVVRRVRSNLPDAHLTLTVYHDPEEEYEHLIIYARFAKYDDWVLERIRHTRSIYRDLLTDCRGWIFLTTDFHPPDNLYAV